MDSLYDFANFLPSSISYFAVFIFDNLLNLSNFFLESDRLSNLSVTYLVNLISLSFINLTIRVRMDKIFLIMVLDLLEFVSLYLISNWRILALNPTSFLSSHDLGLDSIATFNASSDFAEPFVEKLNKATLGSIPNNSAVLADSTAISAN